MGRAQNSAPHDAFDNVLGTRRGSHRRYDSARRLNPAGVQRRLHQDEVWRAQDGQVWRLEDMRLMHVRRLIAMLRRQAGELHDAECAHVEELISAQAWSEREDRELEKLEAQDPTSWLESTPLMRALKARLDQ